MPCVLRRVHVIVQQLSTVGRYSLGNVPHGTLADLHIVPVEGLLETGWDQAKCF